VDESCDSNSVQSWPRGDSGGIHCHNQQGEEESTCEVIRVLAFFSFD
jgi:hypothetical protein